ncbi:phosphatase PAP2 family protein [Proteiniphilum sp. UBA5384]|mgnify:CR=1 FL=1|uniref:phosphatase PAP2 family protein n=1 Tax=Proteiniphilum sp. UBA5384 TaxID=1947279 RepID=UPI0025CF9472|nr:phosphatase PAP2 family protein [Proteiniphilum sp. UBA5384]
MLNKIIPYEEKLFFLINNGHSAFFDSSMWLFSSIKSWIPLIIAILFFIVYKNSWRQWLPILIAMILVLTLSDQFSSHLIKPLFMRPRPSHYPGIMEHVRVLNDYRGGKYGFISGHATNSFGLAMFTSLLFRDRLYSIVVFIWAIIISYSRIYLGVHFPSDIAGGIIAGMTIGYCVYRLYYFTAKKLSQKDMLYLPPRFPKHHTHLLSFIIIGYILILTLFDTSIIKN